MYALAYIAAMFLLPAFIVGGWAYMVERVPFTERGLNVSFGACLALLVGLAAVLGWVLPTPLPGL